MVKFSCNYYLNILYFVLMGWLVFELVQVLKIGVVEQLCSSDFHLGPASWHIFGFWNPMGDNFSWHSPNPWLTKISRIAEKTITNSSAVVAFTQTILASFPTILTLIPNWKSRETQNIVRAKHLVFLSTFFLSRKPNCWEEINSFTPMTHHYLCVLPSKGYLKLGIPRAFTSQMVRTHAP